MFYMIKVNSNEHSYTKTVPCDLLVDWQIYRGRMNDWHNHIEECKKGKKEKLWVSNVCCNDKKV